MTWPADAAVLPLALPLIRIYEGFKPNPYLCPAGKWTIGYGTTKYPDGMKVTGADKAIGKADGERFLAASIARVEADLRPLLTRDPTAAQYAALIGLAYNIGVGVHDGVKGDLADSTLLAKFNAGDIQGAADQFLVWNKAHVNGELTELLGLTKRRQAERALFLKR
jgi:lysozyme